MNRIEPKYYNRPNLKSGTQGILRVVVTGNIECLSTGSQQGYLWLGLSSFIKTVTLILALYCSQSIYLCPALIKFYQPIHLIIVTTLSFQPTHTSVSYEVPTQPVLASRPLLLSSITAG
jgi:hypothetical protein